MFRRLAAPLLASVCALLGLTATAQAAATYYLDIDGVQGESAAKDHKGAIELQSFSWGVSNDGAVRGGKANFSAFSIMKTVDSATPSLIQHVATGGTFPRAKVTGVKTGETPQTFLEYCFTNVAITSVQDSASSEQPSESVSFTYQRFGLRYTPQSPTGAPGNPLFTGWDLVGNRTIGFQEVCRTSS